MKRNSERRFRHSAGEAVLLGSEADPEPEPSGPGRTAGIGLEPVLAGAGRGGAEVEAVAGAERPALEAPEGGREVGGAGSQHLGNIDATGECEVGPHPVRGTGEAKDAPRGGQKGGPHRNGPAAAARQVQDSPVVGAADGGQRRLPEAEHRAHQGAFEPRGAVRVPDRPVREDEGGRVGRSRPGNPVALVSGTAEVLDGGEEAAALHLENRRSFGGRWRGGFRRRAFRQLRHRQEPHLIAGQATARRAPAGIEEERRIHPPEEMPAAGRDPGIDAGLGAGHGDRARRDAHPGHGAARDVEAGVGHPEVGKSRGEADDEDAVLALGVDADQLFHGHANLRRHLRQVLPVIDAGQLDVARGPRGLPAGAAGEIERVGADGFGVRLGVVEDQHRAESGDRLPEAVERLPLEECGERGGPLVQLNGDLVPELDDEGGLAGVPETRLSPAGHRTRF